MTARKNSERIGVEPQSAAQDVPVAKPNDNFAFVLPTELIRLPSEGRFYEKGDPLYGKETIEMKQMTAKEEDILTNASFIKEGVVLDRLLSSLILEPGINVSKMFLGDKNALLYESRRLGYGPTYNVNAMCGVCLESTVWAYDLGDIEIRSASQIEEECGFEFTENGEFIIRIESMKADVELRPLVGADETRLAKILAGKKKHRLPEEPTVEFLRQIIASVNGNSDPVFIGEFIDVLPINETKYLKAEYKERIPGVRARGEFTCENCGTIDEREVPMTHEFFWPKR